MPDRHLLNAIPGQPPVHRDVQQLIEAERGEGTQGIRRAWQASDSNKVVLTSTAAGVKISRDNGTTPPAQVIVDGTPAGGQLAGTYPNPSLSLATVDLLLPPGTMFPFAGAFVPTGWLLCDGSPRSTTTYAKLFAAIGYAYGGSGGTFNLPDARGRVLLGASGTHPRGQVGGAESVAGPAHTHPGSHSHGMNSHTHGPGTHSHGLNSHTHGPGSHTHAQGAHTHGPGSHTHDISGHSHDLGGHAHGPGLHTHDISTHTHDINHDHPNALAAAGASASTLNGRFQAAGANALPDDHTHPVNLPALGITASGVSSAPSTGPPSAANTGAAAGSTGLSSAPTTAPPSANDTGGVSAGAAASGPPSANATDAATGSTAGPSANATDAATGTTALDTSAYDASYSATIAIMQPFVVGAYIIWPGA